MRPVHGKLEYQEVLVIRIGFMIRITPCMVSSSTSDWCYS